MRSAPTSAEAHHNSESSLPNCCSDAIHDVVLADLEADAVTDADLSAILPAAREMLTPMGVKPTAASVRAGAAEAISDFLNKSPHVRGKRRRGWWRRPRRRGEMEAEAALPWWAS